MAQTREQKRVYMRAYRAKHAVNAKYYAKNREKERARRAEYYANNREKVLASVAKYRAANQEKVIAKDRIRGRKRRGLPEPTRPCPAHCELCDRKPRGRGLSLDHDHKTGEFRGWLCHVCNTGLGKLGDDIAGLERAIVYLALA